MIEQLFYKKAFDEAYQFLKKYLKTQGLNLLSRDSDIQDNISSHIKYVNNWSKDVYFRDLGASSKELNSIYVNLNYFLTPKDCEFIKCSIKKVELHDIFKNDAKHTVILGQPGSGKTTTMKYISQQIIHSETFYPEQFNFPLVIRLRTLSNVEKKDQLCGILFDKIINIIGLRVNKSTDDDEQFVRHHLKDSSLRFIDKLEVLIILDGFDEIVPLENKESILKEIEELVLHLSNSKVILTSRSGDFPYKIDNTAIFEIAPLSKKQIIKLSQKWLKSTAKCKDFLKKINESPFKDSSIRPLTISHLCAIYERYGDIPEKPKTIYRKILNLLIEDWDEQRNVKRVSRLGSFDPDRKTDFLSNLAYYTSTELKKTVFNSDELIKAYENICKTFNLPKYESKKVISEIESHTGLFIQSGFESYEFVHKSIQEYLAALYIVKLPTTPDNPYISEYLPNEFAIAISLASDQTAYFSSIVFTTISSSFHEKKLCERFFDIFLNRLIIEKPDFVPNIFLGVSFLYLLYMAYSSSSYENNEYGDDIFDSFIENESVKQSIPLIKNYYEISQQSDLRFKLIELEKQKDAKDQFVNKLPDKILIKRKYLSN